MDRNDRTDSNLERLDRLDDYEVADHEPDPRGWDVMTGAGERIGRVDHLIGDTNAMKVRYLAVDLDREIAKDSRQVLVPVTDVDLDVSRTRVLARGIDRTTAVALPTREALIARGGRSGGVDADTARIQRSEEELAVGTRERQAGEVVVKKHVEKEHVREPVQVHHEEVEVTRRAVDDRGRAASFGDKEFRIPLTEEEVVVEKRPRVKEEVVVRKRDVAETEVVEEDVRKERVDVETRGDVSENKRR